MSSILPRIGIHCVCILVVLMKLSAAGDEGRPWKPQYKIKPHQTDKLTAADVVGPDGIVYPDWRYAGVPGGIPDVPTVAHLADFGGRPNDDQNDSGALSDAIDAVARAGGGALALGSGVYHLDHPVVIPYDGIVIRGQGPDKTRLVFRYAPPKHGVVFFTPSEGDVLGPDSLIEIHAYPEDLQKIALTHKGREISSRERHKHWGGTFQLKTSTSTLLQRIGTGERTLKAIATWASGRQSESTLKVQLRNTPRNKREFGQHLIRGKGAAALEFVGDLPEGTKWPLASDGRRGDTTVQLEPGHALKTGDRIVLEAPTTDRWNELVQNACKWGYYRRYEFLVKKVEGRRVHLNQPLRIDFPKIDGSFVQRVRPIRNCGVEDLTLEQTEKLWTCGVLFSYAWECWAKNLNVIKAGQHAVYTRQAKWCEIRGCRFDDAWYQGGGGTAYVGWEKSYDCLMDNVTTHRMRHAPCVQWSSSGNVIRRSTFHGSDAQWHAGWTNENLYEQCFVDAKGSWGTYGHGGWASPPHDTAHGPEGPRNVVYNCDFQAPKTGLWLGGMNENWLILHNRFVVENGPAILLRAPSFDHIVQGNVFAVRRSTQPGISLSGGDCPGIESLENRLFGGNGRMIVGNAPGLVSRDNKTDEFTTEPPRPRPKVPSIFEWQRRER